MAIFLTHMMRGANLASRAAVVGALAFVFLDRLVFAWLAFGLDMGSLGLDLQTLLLLCGTAVAATLPFSALGGCLLGAVALRYGQARRFIVVGVALGVFAMMGGFAVVYYGAVCVSSHGLCYQDPIGWLDWGVQHDFLSGRYFYPGRLALSTLFGATGGWWAARQIVVNGPKAVVRRLSA